MTSPQPIKRTRPISPTISSRRLVWYPAVFNDPTTISGEQTPYGITDYREIIRTGAFAKLLTNDADTEANVNHAGESFARRASGELILAEDSHGLFATCFLPNNRLGQRVLDAAAAGQISGGSFEGSSFNSWTPGTIPTKEVIEVAELANVCVAIGDQPYYPNTTAALLRTKQDAALKDFFQRLRIIRARG